MGCMPLLLPAPKQSGQLTQSLCISGEILRQGISTKFTRIFRCSISIDLIESKIQAHSLWRASSLQITHCCYTVRNWSCSLQMQSICALKFSLTPAVSAFYRWMKKLGQGRKSHLSADNEQLDDADSSISGIVDRDRFHGPCLFPDINHGLYRDLHGRPLFPAEIHCCKHCCIEIQRCIFLLFVKCMIMPSLLNSF